MRSACAASTFAVLALCAVEAAAQTQADFFDDTLVQEVRLELKASDWATLSPDHFSQCLSLLSQ